MHHTAKQISLTLLCIGLCTSMAEASDSQKVTLRQVAVCPSTASLALLSQLEGAQDPRTCHVACAAMQNCSVVHRTGGTCYFGNSDQRSSLFTLTVAPGTDPCVSIEKDDIVKSKLVLAFDFKQGYSNLISPGKFDATPHGTVTRDAQGANFLGSTTDYIEVDTQNGSLISTFLDHPSNFSFFAKVIRQQQYQTSYHCFHNGVVNGSSKLAAFGDRDGRAWVEHQFLSVSTHPDEAETRQSAQVLSSSSPLAISLGAVFHGKTLSNFYLNGSNLAAEADQGWGPYDAPRFLRLGFHKDAALTLKGRMICYVIAKAALSTAEFQQLDQLCGW